MNILREIGLTDYESKAYQALVKLGKTTASKISTHSSVPYGRIYDTLQSLEQKGIIKALPGITKEYVPTDPKKILEMIGEKKKALEQGELELKELKKYYDTTNKEPVLIATGQKNFYNLMKETTSPKKNYVYNIKYTVEAKPEWMRKDKEKIKNGIDIKTIVSDSEEAKNNIKKWAKFTKIPMKKIHNEGVAMMIHNDEEVLIGLIKSNTTILIRDKAFVKLMKKMYQETWKTAENMK